jgi:hypothetical protein
MNHRAGKRLESVDEALYWEWYQSEVDTRQAAEWEGEKHIAE